MSAPFVLAPGEQHAGAPPPASQRQLIRITSHHTDGLIGLAEVQVPPRTSGPNLHVHTNEDEMFFVLDGVMTVQIGQELHEVATGGLAWGARGTPHAFANLAEHTLRIMIVYVPGGAERIFEEMEAYRRTLGGPADERAVAAIMARYGATRVGPPIPIPEPRDGQQGHRAT